MNYELTVLLSYSILLPVIAALIKAGTVESKYYPFIFCLLIALINEAISTCLNSNGYGNAVNNNIYMLAEAMLILYLFKKWDLFQNRSCLAVIIAVLFAASWIYDNSSLAKLQVYLPYFRCFSSVCIVLLSIGMISRLAGQYPHNLLRSPGFLICASFCLYFSASTLTEIFLYGGWGKSLHFQDIVFRSGVIINVLSNLLYLAAIILMPPRPRYFFNRKAR